MKKTSLFLCAFIVAVIVLNGASAMYGRESQVTANKLWSIDTMTSPFGWISGELKIALIPSQDIVVAGVREEDIHIDGYDFTGYRVILFQLNQDGEIVSSFGEEGFTTTEIIAGEVVPGDLKIDELGNLLLAGTTQDCFFLQKFLPNGVPDPSYNGGNYQYFSGPEGTQELKSLVLSGQDEVFLIGRSGNYPAWNLIIMNINIGTADFDDTFGIPGDCGIVTTDFDKYSLSVSSACLDSEGNLLVVGSMKNSEFEDSDLFLAKFDQTGVLVSSFGDGGVVYLDINGEEDYADSLLIQEDGKILVGGNTYDGNDYDIFLVRLNSNGSIDSSFGEGGVLCQDIGGENDFLHAMCADNEGRHILVSGGTLNNGLSNSYFQRYTQDGVVDSSFGQNGIVIQETDRDDFIYEIESDGKNTFIVFEESQEPDFSFFHSNISKFVVQDQSDNDPSGSGGGCSLGIISPTGFFILLPLLCLVGKR